jgi:IS30 family transposase
MDNPAIKAYVRHGLGHDWSPEQISGRMRREHPDEPRRRVSPRRIYTWIKSDQHRDHWQSHLRRRGKRPRRRKAAETPAAARVAHRPAVIEERRRLNRLPALPVEALGWNCIEW